MACVLSAAMLINSTIPAAAQTVQAADEIVVEISETATEETQQESAAPIAEETQQESAAPIAEETQQESTVPMLEETPQENKTAVSKTSQESSTVAISDEIIQNISDNLCELYNQVISDYNEMTQSEKDAISKMDSDYDADKIISTAQELKAQVTFEALKKRLKK